jgi:N-acetylglucosaminyldiphosphoundecaprenol N-acetyl-beta-D-mannosaminyltransferase
METRIFGYPVHLLSDQQAIEIAERAFQQEASLQVVTLNPEMIMQGDADPELGRILKGADLALPDGAGLVWALRKRGHAVKRLPGIEFSEGLLQRAAATGRTVAIIGAQQDVLDLAVEGLQRKYPGLALVYTHHGFFPTDSAEEAQIAKDCAAAKPHIVLVALGVPRQEKWIDRYRHGFQGAVLVGIGGSLDVWSGKTQRAPELFRRLNLEWMYRITTQPWRIKRTYKTLPMFVVKVLLSGGSA